MEQVDGNTLLVPIASSGTSKVLDAVIRSRKKKSWYKLSESEQAERKVRRINEIERCMHHGCLSKGLIRKKKTSVLNRCNPGCHSRMCAHCVESRRVKYRFQLQRIVEQYADPRMITVGFSNVSRLTKSYLKRCSLEFNQWRKNIKRLSRSGEKKGDRPFYIESYVSILEIKFNAKGSAIYHTDWKRRKKIAGYYAEDNWNVHFHMIYDGTFIPHAKAVKALVQATRGGSRYVWFDDISPKRNVVRNRAKALWYITKYVSKMVFSTSNVDRAIEYYKATFTIRFVRIWGVKAEKEEGKYELYTKTLVNQGFSYLDALLIEHETLEVMEFWGAKQWDYELPEEENVFLYAHKEMQLLALLGGGKEDGRKRTEVQVSENSGSYKDQCR